MIRKLAVRCCIRLLKLFWRNKFRRFQQALSDPERAQQNVIRQSVIEFQKHNPITPYELLEEKILLQLKENHNPIQFTSGSSGAKKIIPYSKLLLSAFQHGFALWCYDILTHVDGFKTGIIYISATPKFFSMPDELADFKVIAEDDDYLTRGLRFLFKPFLLNTESLNHINNPEEYRQRLALLLFHEPRLEVISIWSPTFLLTLLATLQAFKPDRNWREVWPNLKFISCWSDGNSAISFQKLQQQFPDVIIQGKGLLATEGPMTIPLFDYPACVPLLESVFFEFIDKNQNLFLLHELHHGEIYELVISIPGGFIRYPIGDCVQVVGFAVKTPLLKFIKRAHKTSDLVGEKLTEEFVIQCMESTLPGGKNVLLVPSISEQVYYLLIESSAEFHPQHAIDFENALQSSPYYAQARQLGQLSPLQIKHVPELTKLLQDTLVDCGFVLGAIKDQRLIHQLEIGNKLIQRLTK